MINNKYFYNKTRGEEVWNKISLKALFKFCGFISNKPEADFKDFEPRLKYETRFKHGFGST